MSATDSSTRATEDALEQPLAALAPATALDPRGEQGDEAVRSIEPFDFRAPVRLSSSELRKFRLEHESFVQSLAARLSIHLRLEFGVKISQLETRSYQKFLQSLASPCDLTLFKVEPLRGIGILELSPKLALAMIDRLMGGPGKAPEGNRDLSEVEIALLDQAVQLILGEWCGHWAKVQQLEPVVLGHENTGRFLQTSPPDSLMVSLGMEVRMGQDVEQMQIAFPYTTLEPLLQKLSSNLHAPGSELRKSPGPVPPRWRPEFDDLPIAVNATWPGVKLSARKIASLKPGDVIPLPPDFADAIRLRLGGTPRFVGRLGTTDQHWAIELTQVLRT